MSAEQLAEANALLTSPPPVGLALSRSLGFIVVGRLARRLRVSVRIAASPAGGVTAVVDVPAAVLAGQNDADPHVGGPMPGTAGRWRRRWSKIPVPWRWTTSRARRSGRWPRRLPMPGRRHCPTRSRTGRTSSGASPRSSVRTTGPRATHQPRTSSAAPSGASWPTRPPMTPLPISPDRPPAGAGGFRPSRRPMRPSTPHRHRRHHRHHRVSTSRSGPLRIPRTRRRGNPHRTGSMVNWRRSSPPRPPRPRPAQRCLPRPLRPRHR